MKKRCWLVPMLLLSLVLWGCGGTNGNIDGKNTASEVGDEELTSVLAGFFDAYQEGSEAKMAEYAIGSEGILQEVDAIISLFHYDAASSDIIRSLFRGFEYTIANVETKTDNEATIRFDLGHYGLYGNMSFDITDAMTVEPVTLAPMQNDFSNASTGTRSGEAVYTAVLKKDGDTWKVDLTDERNRDLVANLAGGFIRTSEMVLNNLYVNVHPEEDKVLPAPPNNEMIFKDGATERVYDVNPMQREERLAIPFYQNLYEYYYLSWQEDPPTLYAIKEATVITIPFKTVPLGIYEVTWLDMANGQVETLEPVA